MKFFFSNNGADVAKKNPTTKNQFTDEKELIKVISSQLKETINSNKTTLKPENISRYHSSSIPAISIENYLYRFMKRLSLPPNIYIAMFIYLDTYLANDPSNTKQLTELNVHRLLACSLLLAYKFHVDRPHSNLDIAKTAGIYLPEFNYLEWDFFIELNQKLLISVEEYEDCHQKLLSCSS
jgi:hypothetical protein